MSNRIRVRKLSKGNCSMVGANGGFMAYGQDSYYGPHGPLEFVVSQTKAGAVGELILLSGLSSFDGLIDDDEEETRKLEADKKRAELTEKQAACQHLSATGNKCNNCGGEVNNGNQDVAAKVG